MEKYIVWVKGRDGEVTEQAVVGGKEVNGEPLYVGRFMVEEDLVPGKIPATHRVCYAPYGCKEHYSSEYEYLIQPRKGKLKWKPAFDGQVPEGAVDGGYTKYNETLYIARSQYKSSLVVGKLHKSEHCAFISYNGEEISVQNYEVLIFKNSTFAKEARKFIINLPRILLRSITHKLI